MRRSVVMVLLKRMFIVFSMVFLSGVYAKMPISLPKGEQVFKPFKTYTLASFHFTKPLLYMDVVSFQTEPSDGETFKLPKNYTFFPLFSVGHLEISKARQKRAFDYLAHAILRKDYFWKTPWPPAFIYNFTTLRFMEADDKRLKAITQPQDILDLLGEIDTEAELRLWIEAKFAASQPVSAYSWKKEGSLYRVRFRGINPFTCIYHEYFIYIDKYGKKIREKKQKQYRQKGCEIIMT